MSLPPRARSAARPLSLILAAVVAVLLLPGVARAAVDVKINFQPAASTVPAGYTADTGVAYSATRGSGWIRQDSVGSAPVPLSVTGNTRDRGGGTDPTRTLVHMQFPPTSTVAGAERTPAAWVYDLPNGTYSVKVGVGDATSFDSTHTIRLEGQTVIDRFVPSSSSPFMSATASVTVTDGQLTLDAIGGTNTKLDYVTIVNQADMTPPPAPTVTATPGNSSVSLSWDTSTATDLAGYDVFRSTTTPVPTTDPLNGATRLTGTSFTDNTAFNGTSYFYVVRAMDTSGNTSVSAPAQATPTGATTTLDKRWNFQPAGTTPPDGFTADTGLPYSSTRGFGWIRQDSLPDATHVALDMSAWGRKRNVVADARLDSFVHMQPAGQTPAAWEASVPAGSYDVQVGVGDASFFNSAHAISIEGQVAIQNFVPSASVPFKTVTKTVSVADGRLTISAVGGTNTKLDYVTITTAPAGNRPSVRSVAPAEGATGVNRAISVSADLVLPNTGAGVDTNTLSSSTVRLVRASDGAAVPANVNTSGGGDVLVLVPKDALAATTQYRFEVTNGLKDLTGAPFLPTTSTFTTGTVVGSGDTSPAKFQQVNLPTATGKSFSSLTMGPDGKLYAATLDGDIMRWPVNADGTLGAAQTISSLTTAMGGPRMIVGLAFDPASTASNLILWVTHNYSAYANAPDWTGAVARLSGPDLATVDNKIVGLPRSVRDHETNSLAFGPDGALYLTQGSNSSAGAPDTPWGNRDEHLLNAAVLRIDTTKLPASAPLDVKTSDGGTYNPYAAGAAVTLWATGLRNPFDLVFHSNGQLYAPTNGAGTGGNTPATPSPLPASCSNRIDAATRGAYTGPAVPTLTDLPVAQDDFLFRVVRGGYYGHPNASRCEWVLNGGNPTSGTDPAQVAQYPVGTQPDRNYRGAAFDFGLHFSPDGAIEYKANTFNGALKGSLLVTRYSAGDDIIALTPNGTTGDIVNAETGITGFTGFEDPLDLVEGPNGTIYVSQLTPEVITLLRPVETAGVPKIAAVTSRRVFNDVTGGAPSAPKDVTVRNSGTGSLTITGATFTGTDAGSFALGAGAPSFPATVAPGASLSFPVTFDPATTGVKGAAIRFASNDPVTPTLDITLRGLGTAGQFGANEPSLQRILDTYQLTANVGDPDPSDSALPSTNPLGDETYLQRMRRSDDTQPVTIEPLAVFTADGPSTTAAAVGYNVAGSASSRTQLFTVANGADQALDPATTGNLSFDPGNGSFGLFSTFAAFGNRAVFGEDVLNTFTGALPHQARFYPLKDASGTVTPNAYVFAFEDTTTATDYNDVVGIIRNVEPAATNARVKLTNQDGAPFDDRLAFNRIGSLTSPPANVVHDQATVRITNSGTDPLTIGALNISGPFELVSPPALPLTLAANAGTNVTVKFNATAGDVRTGSLDITSNDPTKPTTSVQLAGFWQSVSEGGQEPTLAELVTGVFGYGTVITKPGEDINQHGKVATVGDEVLSPYWQRVDTSKGITVTQLASFHTQGNTATLNWFMRGGSKLRGIVTSAGADGQSVLPHRSGATTLATGTVFPAAEFGFKADSEWSDDLKNSTVADQNAGCTGPCGHHMRFFPVKDRAGNVVPNTWLIAMDYSGINYDYNDNVWLVTNMRPDVDGPVLSRIDVGGPGPFTDSRGRTWQPDTGLFSPSTAPAEGATTTPLEIADTTDDPIYQTYRGNVGSVPQDQRILDYAIPVPNATAVDVRLWVAERASTNNAAGKRLFDIYAEGTKVLSAFDIFAAAGGLNTAYVRALNNIPVTDGVLNLSFRATVDYPSVAGIEVLCAAGCTSG